MGAQRYHNLGNGAFSNVTCAMGMVDGSWNRPRYGVTESNINNDGSRYGPACASPMIHRTMTLDHQAALTYIDK